jgi:alkylresorcinol/alkylpyrone synthase
MIQRLLGDARVLGVGTAFPDHVLDRSGAEQALTRLFPDHSADLVRSMVGRSGVDRRALVDAPGDYGAGSDFSSRNRRYREVAAGLAARACEQALERAGVDPAAVDAILDISCTGVVLPALDAELLPMLGMRRDVQRIPITEAGCAGGALALSVAGRLARTGMTVLVVAVELCSLTLCPTDRSRTNLVASVIFGDGAAAAVVGPEGRGPRILASRSLLLEDTRQVMGFDVGHHGLRIILQPELPRVVGEALPEALREFLAAEGVDEETIGVHLVHPGGKRILDAYEEAFELGPLDLEPSRGVLADHGNLSSASILAVLGRALWEGPQEGTRGLLVAIGPGLSFEMSLLEWDAA